MKKIIFLILCLCGLLMGLSGGAEEARDITAEAKITVSAKAYHLERLRDRDYTTTYSSGSANGAYIEITAAEPCYGVYVCFGADKLLPWCVKVKEGKKWVSKYESSGQYAHEYIALDGETQFRICYQSTKSHDLSVNELYLFSEGDVPDYVQIWQPTVEKADLMILVAHPDDEILFMGGMLPTYAGERNYQVVVCYMTCGTTVRRSELLNGLWLCGVRNYPDIGTFWDKYTTKLDKMYSVWGKSKSHKYIISLIRKYKPEVVVTHDVNGEYGHGAHRVCADTCLNYIAAAADETKYTDSAKTYGTWQVKKLYLHLYKENQIELDWDTPLDAFDGQTGMEIARQAYKLHASQPQKGYWVYGKEDEYNSSLFGLAYTVVGEDVEKNDLFEHITLENAASEAAQ